MRKVFKLGLIGLVLLSLGSCFDSDQSDTPVEPQTSISERSEYLPYGVPVPVGTVIEVGPEPWDPEKHGPPRANPYPERNLAQYPDSMAPIPPRKPPVPAPATQALTYPNEGRWFLYYGEEGIHTSSHVRTDFTWGSFDGNYLYAPTHLPYGGSCLEATFAHYLVTGGWDTKHQFWVWDHCNDNDFPELSEDVTDPYWRNDYVRNMGDPVVPTAYVEVVDYSGCWRVQIYNFNAGQYDLKGEVCNQSRSNDYGWTMWEWESFDQGDAQSCLQQPTISSPDVGLIQELGSVWMNLRDAENSGYAVYDEYGTCFTSNQWFLELTGSSPTPHQAGWTAHTPF